MTAISSPLVSRPRREQHGITTWGVKRLGYWADRRDAARGLTVESLRMPVVPPIGAFATGWASVKFLLMAVSSPVATPLVLARAAANHRHARKLIADFPHQFDDIVRHRHPLPPANRAMRITSPERAFISSDLHRCVPGRNDWPARQHTKSLYATMLDFYADHEAHLVENGDIEDYWMMGGSCYGAMYDVIRLTQWAIPGEAAATARRELYRGHLDRIIANNAGIYQRIHDRFTRHGRYHRTVGNHDDVYLDRVIARTFRDRIGVDPVDWLVFDAVGGETEAVIAHGHHTDGWCSPHRARLGRLSSWVAGTCVDVPFLQTPEGLPPPGTTDSLLGGHAPNRLLTVDPVFGASRNYDSLDEELLFEAMGAAATAGPWLMFGHTHVPVDRPRSHTGTAWTRYMNSGSGVTRELVTGLEWRRDERGAEVQLVAWTYGDDETPPEAIVAHDDGRPVARYVLNANDDGHLTRGVEPYVA